MNRMASPRECGPLFGLGVVGFLGVAYLGISLLVNNIANPHQTAMEITSTPTLTIQSPTSTPKPTSTLKTSQSGIGQSLPPNCVVVQSGDSAYRIWESLKRPVDVDFWNIGGPDADGSKKTLHIPDQSLPNLIHPGDKIGSKSCTP